MCGIAGFLGAGDTGTLNRMSAVLKRRGPDDQGVFLHEEVGLAHARLAIIDLSPSGHQPMKSSTGNSVISFVGEIYNFQELRKEITTGGQYRFHSQSDTEVILALYELYGVDSFSKLNGMFAFGLYDVKEKKLILVRDRLGEKPLYWGVFNDTLIFGSEMKALMCHKDFKKEIDPSAVEQYLTYEYVPTPFSLLQGVRKLGAGSYLICKKGEKPIEKSFWEMPRTTSALSFTEATEQLDTLLRESVANRLVSDVPLGVFLSGGLDSSTVAYYASQVSKEQLKTFSIGFTDKDFDESYYADIAARALGVSHTTEMFSPERCLALIPEVFSYLDEPVADASILPTYLLSAFTRKHVTVALSGNGSDELFAGYPTFKAEELVHYYTQIPETLRRVLIEPIIHALPVRHSYFSFDFKLKRFLEGVEADNRYRHQRWLGAFSDTEMKEICIPQQSLASPTSPYTLLDPYFHEGSRAEFLNDLLWSYARTYLMDEVLVNVDRASMANSLEVRSPFLDHTLVEFAQSLPYAYKYNRGVGKYILKKLMEDKLPREIVYRTKKGFGIPIGRWLQHELKPLSDELLSQDAIKKSGVFDSSAVDRIKKEHEEGRRDNRKKLWTLMVFQMWYRQWGSTA